MCITKPAQLSRSRNWKRHAPCNPMMWLASLKYSTRPGSITRTPAIWNEPASSIFHCYVPPRHRTYTIHSRWPPAGRSPYITRSGAERAGLPPCPLEYEVTAIESVIHEYEPTFRARGWPPQADEKTGNPARIAEEKPGRGTPLWPEPTRRITAWRAVVGIHATPGGRGA
ncbi:hypothetical protein HNY73_013070 [Argiope bruennichi]|uniref:Uncharacterized protein n=1 Tax=Argiope bruennichi TaxID=94029 RepID=A0A8T0EYS3_ARGBR|nr:hypothetical protein HNY73_013070 [Argiope bruennichi]